MSRTERRDQANELRVYRATRLAELFNVHITTITAWRKKGLLPEPAFRLGGIRGWSEAQVRALFKESNDEASK